MSDHYDKLTLIMLLLVWANLLCAPAVSEKERAFASWLAIAAALLIGVCGCAPVPF